MKCPAGAWAASIFSHAFGCCGGKSPRVYGVQRNIKSKETIKMVKPLIYAAIAAMYVMSTANVPTVSAKTQAVLHSTTVHN